MQNELFYSYIDDNDKEFMAIEAAADIEMQKSLLALEYADRLYDIKLRQAELKVLNESGTFEDLDALYEAAGKENSERKDGIIKTIWNKISKFISDIKTAIVNLVTKKKVDDFTDAANSGKLGNINLPKDPNKIMDAVKSALSKVSRFLRPGITVTKEDGEKVFSIGKTLITTIEGIGAVTIGAIAIPKLWVKLQGMGNDIQKKCEELKNNPPLGEGAAAIGNFFQSCADKVLGSLKSLGGIISAGADKVKGGVEKAAGAVKNVAGKIGSKGNSEEEVATEESVDDFDGIIESTEFEESCDDIINSINAILD